MTAPRFEPTSQRQKVSRLPIQPPGRPAYGHYIEQSMDQLGNKTVNPARGQLNRENEYSPVPIGA